MEIWTKVCVIRQKNWKFKFFVMEKAADKTNFIQTTRGNLGQFGNFWIWRGIRLTGVLSFGFSSFFRIKFLNWNEIFAKLWKLIKTSERSSWTTPKWESQQYISRKTRQHWCQTVIYNSMPTDVPKKNRRKTFFSEIPTKTISQHVFLTKKIVLRTWNSRKSPILISSALPNVESVKKKQTKKRYK